MVDRPTRLDAFDFSYEELHKNRDLGRLSERQYAEFRARTHKHNLILSIYVVIVVVIFGLMMIFFASKLWLILPCGVCASVGGVGVWVGYELWLDRRIAGDNVLAAPNIPKSHIQTLRYPIEAFTHRVEVDKFRALLTQDQYNSLDDDTSYDFYYKPADYYHGDFRIFSVDPTWTPARRYRVMCWRAADLNLPAIYDLDLDPGLDPMELPTALHEAAIEAKAGLEDDNADENSTKTRLDWFLLHTASVGLLAFGELGAAEDVLNTFPFIDRHSTYYTKVTQPLMNALRDLLPLPRDMNSPTRDGLLTWLDENQHRLAWDEKRGKYVLVKE